jgi:Protein of unknown function (DUF1566)
MSRFIKIDSAGEHLAQDAAEWVAVLDTKQGLMFTATETREMTHAKEMKHVAALDVGGFKDWRLPTVEELFLLADRSRKAPAIDAVFFPKCKSDWYWTSTLYVPFPGGYAWLVNFDSGDADWFCQDYEGLVRACRDAGNNV